MPINQTEPVFDRLSERDRKILKINQPPQSRTQLDHVRDQAKDYEKRQKKGKGAPEEWA